jgi:hypothetical protein
MADEAPEQVQAEVKSEPEHPICVADKSLGLLFDYTKFHIGCYLTLTGSYIAAASIKFGSTSAPVLNVNLCLMWPAIFCFMFAGFAGGTIASSITQTTACCTKKFLNEEIGPWDLKPFKAKTWTWIEHTTFWVGMILAVFSIGLAGKHC